VQQQRLVAFLLEAIYEYPRNIRSVKKWLFIFPFLSTNPFCLVKYRDTLNYNISFIICNFTFYSSWTEQKVTNGFLFKYAYTYLCMYCMWIEKNTIVMSFCRVHCWKKNVEIIVRSCVPLKTTRWQRYITMMVMMRVHVIVIQKEWNENKMKYLFDCIYPQSCNIYNTFVYMFS